MVVCGDHADSHFSDNTPSIIFTSASIASLHLGTRALIQVQYQLVI
jgi:hypothetical protein